MQQILAVIQTVPKDCATICGF